MTIFAGEQGLGTYPDPEPASSIVGNYGLSDAEASELARELVWQHGSTGEAYSCYLIEGASPYADLGRTVERKVFDAKFGNDVDEMREEYGPYEAQSESLVVLQHATDTTPHQPVLALRVIKDGASGFKTMNDAAGSPFYIEQGAFQVAHNVPDLKTCQDIGTVAVPAELQGPRMDIAGKLGSPLPVTAIAYRALLARAQNQGVTDWVSAIDKGAHSIFTALGVPFVPILGRPGGPYLGSPHTTILHTRVDAITPGMRKREAEHLQTLADADSERRKRMSRYIADNIAAHLDGQGVDKLIHFDFGDAPI